jgi:hypothetical protein
VRFSADAGLRCRDSDQREKEAITEQTDRRGVSSNERRRQAREARNTYKVSSELVWQSPFEPYNHIGGMLADAVLQASRDYYKIVTPRVDRIQELYPEATTTMALRNLLKKVSVETFLQYKSLQRAQRFSDLLELLYDERIQDVQELKKWLRLKDSARKKGIGPKTADYLKILVGITTTAAMDRHLFGFLEMAGVNYRGYDDAREIVHGAANLLGREAGLLASKRE